MVFYEDLDGDTFGNASVTKTACEAPENFVADNTDCDDTRAAVYPGAVELCNGIDDNCDATVDNVEDANLLTFYQDLDGDEYGNPDVSEVTCPAPEGYVSNS